MRAIEKGPEPTALTQYRANPGAVYDGSNFTSVKEQIRTALLEEQGELCAYCMQRIAAASMKVEHWQSQTRYSGNQLNYGNMLACCPGNEGSPPKEQHCDTRKGEQVISLNPANPAHHPLMRIRYAGDGTIRSDNTQFNDEINSVLNLNWIRLRSNRKSVWESVTQVLSQTPGTRTRNEIQKLIVRWQKTDAEGQLREYCAVAIYYLSKKLAKTR